MELLPVSCQPFCNHVEVVNHVSIGHHITYFIRLFCRTLHLSVIKEENEEISPAITLLRKPKFSRHFSKPQDIAGRQEMSPGLRSSSSVNDLVANIKEKLRTPPQPSRDGQSSIEMARRSSDSMLTSQAAFTVLPPINSVDNNEENHDGESFECEGDSQKDEIEKPDVVVERRSQAKSRAAKEDLILKLSEQLKINRVTQPKEL